MSAVFVVLSIFLGLLLFLFIFHYIYIRTLTVIKAEREGGIYSVTVKRFLIHAETYRCERSRDRLTWYSRSYQIVEDSTFLHDFLSACLDAIDIKEELEARGIQKDEEDHPRRTNRD